MIRAEKVGYRIRDAVLLRQVDIDVRPGHVTVIVGANGAGKSTLLRILSREAAPTEGSVYLDDRPLSAFADRDLALRRSVMPQRSTLSFPFRVFEVVLLGRTPHTRGGEHISDHELVTEALEFAGADHLAERRYTTLSGGERQRVDFARALVQVWETSVDGPRYLLLDEPTSSLDLARQHELLAAARRFASEDLGVLVVLHDLNLAARYGDEIVVLKEGRVVADGPPRVVLTPERVQHAFGLPVIVTDHPSHDCPLVVPDVQAPRGERRPARSTTPR